MIALETMENVLVDYDAWKNRKSTAPVDISVSAYLAEGKALRDSELLERVREIVNSADGVVPDVENVYGLLVEALG